MLIYDFFEGSNYSCVELVCVLLLQIDKPLFDCIDEFKQILYANTLRVIVYFYISTMILLMTSASSTSNSSFLLILSLKFLIISSRLSWKDCNEASACRSELTKQVLPWLYIPAGLRTCCLFCGFYLSSSSSSNEEKMLMPTNIKRYLLNNEAIPSAAIANILVFELVVGVLLIWKRSILILLNKKLS